MARSMVAAIISSMKAARIHSFGDSKVVKIEEISIPKPGPGEVLVKVRASSVNPVDLKIRSGQHKMENEVLPLTLGRDISGVVSAVGPNVNDVKEGDEVMALLDWEHGGNAEYAIAKRDGLAPKPASLDYSQAAAVPLAAMTAWQGSFLAEGRIEAGRTRIDSWRSGRRRAFRRPVCQGPRSPCDRDRP